MKKINHIEILTKSPYDFSKFVYRDVNSKSILICEEHGEFQISLRSIIRGSGCKECGDRMMTTNQFIKNSKEIFFDKFDYSKTKYINSRTNLIITCKEHGDFSVLPKLHLSGQYCKFCKKIDSGLKFIERSKSIHPDLIYDFVDYQSNKIPVRVVCPKHGEFLVRPDNHISNKNGCPKCSLSKGEKDISRILDSHCIEYSVQKTFDGCSFKSDLRFDFYLPKYKTCIEFNGPQHYQSIEFFGGDSTLEYNKIRDDIKIKWCNSNDIELIVIKYDESIIQKLNFLFK
jgi:hypothetical protein